jgi:predicted ribosome quality control (RQC) complex YloA/Tae2 family protein
MHSSPRCPRVRQEARRKIGPDGSKDHGGIGNIYSEEILFQARIDPAERMDKVAPGELKRLFLEMSKVLRTAIAHGAGSKQLTERMPKGSLLPERKKGGRCPPCRSLLKILKVVRAEKLPWVFTPCSNSRGRDHEAAR